jgi:hypothetical protein
MSRQEDENDLTLKLHADYNGQPVALKGTIGSIHQLLKHERFPVQLSGKFSNAAFIIDGAVDDILNLKDIDLKAHASGTDLAALGLDESIPLPKTSTFDVMGLLRGSKASLALIDISGNLSRSDVDLTFSGSVGDSITFSGIDLRLKGFGRNLSAVGSIIGERLPTTDKFALQGRLTGSAKALSLKETEVSADRGSLRFTVNGEVKDLLNLSGMDLQSKLTGKDLAEFGAVIEEKLPATDQFEIQGRLTGSTETLTLREAQGSARRGSLRLKVKGIVNDLLTLEGMDLQSRLTGKDLAEFGAVIEEKLPPTDQFEIQGRLIGSTAVLALQQVQGNAGRDSMRLSLNGSVKDLLTLKGMDLKSRLTGKEMSEMGSLMGANLPALGAFDVSGQISGSVKSLSIDKLAAILDKSDFNGLARVEILKRPKLTVRLESSVIDFTAWLKSLERGEQEPVNVGKQKRRLFNDDPLPFDILKKVDADIVLKAENIHAKDARLDFAHLVIKLEDHDLSIDKLEATYKETKISGNLQINSGSPSRVSIHFLAQGFNLGDFLKETGKSDQVQAIVDIAAHGKSRGESVKSLIANLDGSIGAVMGEGYLTKYLDMLSVGLSKKVIQFWKPPKEVDQIKCAVVQFDIKEGVATSQAFWFNNRAGILTGEGEINLGTEKINFLLVPKPTHPDLSLATKLRVSGSVMDPKVGVHKLAALTRGG